MTFLIAQLVLISSWILVNLHMIPGVSAFDPFPFGVLEGVFLTLQAAECAANQHRPQ
jgi:uncharacterized membrane protein